MKADQPELEIRRGELQRQLEESLQARAELESRLERLEREKSRIEEYLIQVLSSRPYQSTLLLRRIWRKVRRFRFVP